MTTSPPLERSWTHQGRPLLRLRGQESPAGPWDDEPDKVQWVDPGTDLDCLAVRNSFGAWCGYVGVPASHPFYERPYDDVPVEGVHGGLTFSASCDEDAAEGHGICHVPFPGRTGDVWWLGFDCAHLLDLTPYDAALEAAEPNSPIARLQRRGPYRKTYKTLDYVRRECTSLAAQIAAATQA